MNLQLIIAIAELCRATGDSYLSTVINRQETCQMYYISCLKTHVDFNSESPNEDKLTRMMFNCINKKGEK